MKKRDKKEHNDSFDREIYFLFDLLVLIWPEKKNEQAKAGDGS